MRERPSPTRTPDVRYYVRFNDVASRWVVVPLYHLQAERMRASGVKHVYDSSAQAYAVQKKLNDSGAMP